MARAATTRSGASAPAEPSDALTELVGQRYKAFPLKRLIPYARNSRKHSRDQIALLKGSLVEFGWTRPVAFASDNATIYAGHGIVQAALELAEQGGCPRYWPDPWAAPVVDLAHLSESQRRAYVVADNRLAEKGSAWDDEMLAMELGALAEDGLDLSSIGFDEADLRKLLEGAGPGGGNTDPDDVPEVQADPVSVLGDVWLLGRHRLVCGDSTDAGAVEKALGGVTPHLMVTDPPYGVEYDPGWRGEALKDGAKRAEGRVENDGQADWREAWTLFPGDVAYVWHAMLHAGTVFNSLVAAGFLVRAEIVWAKPRHVLSRGHYHPQHESAWYAVRKGATAHWAGDRSQTTVWQIEHQKSDTGHGTQKPVECMRRPIENNSSPGQAVYEPFSGSGTTIIAAEQTGRACHAIELNPLYVDVAIRRWQAFTGQSAHLEGDGRTFAEIEAERLASSAAA